MNERDQNDLFARIDFGIKRGVARAIEEHRQSGQSISVWQDGQVVEDPLCDSVDSVILFLDILGYKTLLENKEDFKNLFLAINNIRKQNIPKFQVKYGLDKNSPSMEAVPIMTSFSDCIVLSVPVNEIKEPFDIGHAVHILLSYLQQIADSLMTGGFILRGGLTRGNLYHTTGIVFGKALIEAYELEKKAKNPRILVSDQLAEEYNKSKYDQNNFLIKEIVNGKDEYNLDYLKLCFQSQENKIIYKEKTEDIIKQKRQIILDKINRNSFDQLEQDIEILKKWIYFGNYVETELKNRL